MGEGQSKSKGKKGSVPRYTGKIDKFELDVCLQNIKFTGELHQGRRKGDINRKEKELIALVSRERKDRDKTVEFEKARSIVYDSKLVAAYGYIQTYCGILKDHQMEITNSNGDYTKVQELFPYVESVIWGCQKVSLEPGNKLIEFLMKAYGFEYVQEVNKFEYVNKELRELFSSMSPSDLETKNYICSFCSKFSFDIEVFNEIGHSINPSELEDFPPNKQPSSPYIPLHGSGKKPGDSPIGGGGNHGMGGGYMGGGGGTGIYQPNFDNMQKNPYNMQPNQFNPNQQFNQPFLNPHNMHQNIYMNQGVNQPNSMPQNIFPQQPPNQMPQNIFAQQQPPRQHQPQPQPMNNNNPPQYHNIFNQGDGMNNQIDPAMNLNQIKPHLNISQTDSIRYSPTHPPDAQDLKPNGDEEFNPEYPDFKDTNLLAPKPNPIVPGFHTPMPPSVLNPQQDAPPPASLLQFQMRMEKIKEGL